MPHTWDPDSLSPEEALDRLEAGNRRFLAAQNEALKHSWAPEETAGGQRPFAVVLGCSDSRTPIEIIFDQGLGDLFVVRNAGNIAVPSVVGSIEFAVSEFGARLVVVMGHTRCGAVGATIRTIETGYGPQSSNIRFITDRIAPHIEALVDLKAPAEQRAAAAREAVRAHVRATVGQLSHGSEILAQLLSSQRLVIVGAEYDLETGAVTFLDDD